ncbi:hypothetical protein L204_105792 [Cryptococcus depauperatus]|nr:hypothetical protein L204_06056 [Cryptococcus depauperatus CBS 7855]
MTCSGNPADCSFCGSSNVDCAKSEVQGCTTNPSDCGICQGRGCVALQCTGNTDTCPACKNTHSSCRKIQATEGVERARPRV